ncbi:MAG TPA: hypothetical protein VGS28_04035 [Candidatus Saccharimonadales bacterium]|nr:hypothetical protein [Candidatus Saccharimonadales bacterium]
MSEPDSPEALTAWESAERRLPRRVYEERGAQIVLAGAALALSIALRRHLPEFMLSKGTLAGLVRLGAAAAMMVVNAAGDRYRRKAVEYADRIGDIIPVDAPDRSSPRADRLRQGGSTLGPLFLGLSGPASFVSPFATTLPTVFWGVEAMANWRKARRVHTALDAYTPDNVHYLRNPGPEEAV